jgi:GNAT superfamily N-acetyltransferase
MSVEIRKVESKKDLKTFVDFHYDLYEGNAYDVPTLFSDDMATLSRDKNAAFDFCEAEYYLAYKDGKLVGRVAAIINHKANKRWERKTCRFGWIDFIDDIEVSKALLDAVTEYGRSKGMTEVVGPLGFTDFDPEGMLTDGYDQLGTFATIYNYPYYPQHMEKLGGWVKDNDYVEYKIIVPEKMPEKHKKIAQMVEKRYNLHVHVMTKHEVYKEGKGIEVFKVINEAFKDIYGFSELSDRQIMQYINQYLPYGDLRLIPVVEDWNNNRKIVAVGITLPSLSKAMQKTHRGRLFPFGWWHILRSLKCHKTNIVDLEMVGVLPEYRSKGAVALLFAHLIPLFQKFGFEWGESQVEMETNDNVQNQWQAFETVQHKRRRCFKKEIK